MLLSTRNALGLLPRVFSLSQTLCYHICVLIVVFWKCGLWNIWWTWLLTTAGKWTFGSTQQGLWAWLEEKHNGGITCLKLVSCHFQSQNFSPGCCLQGLVACAAPHDSTSCRKIAAKLQSRELSWLTEYGWHDTALLLHNMSDDTYTDMRVYNTAVMTGPITFIIHAGPVKGVRHSLIEWK